MEGIINTNVVSKQFGNRLREARNAMKFTRQGFCDKINAREDNPIRRNQTDMINPERLKKWEYGENPVDIEWIPAICAELNIDVGYLFGEYPEHTRKASDIVAATGMSERTVSSIIAQPQIVDALNSLDQDELLDFSCALNNALDLIIESVSMLERDDPDERWRIGLQHQKTELAVFRFREVCGDLINKWCNLEYVLSEMNQKEEAYLRELEEEEAKQEKEREEAAKRPPLTAEEKEELFQKWRLMIDRTEADNG